MGGVEWQNRRAQTIKLVDANCLESVVNKGMVHAVKSLIGIVKLYGPIYTS
jgi:hypothetical protein